MSEAKQEQSTVAYGSKLWHGKNKTQGYKGTSHTEVYGQFAKVYDDIYDPVVDYSRDATFIDELVSKFSNASRHPSQAIHILDVGCGTGSHLIELAKFRRYKGTGLDISSSMIAKGKKKASQLDRGIRPIFLLGDMRNFNLFRQFDVVICMLNSFGYALSETDARRVLANIRSHLAPGGLVVLEFWQKGVIREGDTHHLALPFTEKYSLLRRNVRRVTKFRILNDLVEIYFGFEVFGIRFIRDFGPTTLFLPKIFSEVHRLRLYSIDEFVNLARECQFEILGLFNRGGLAEIVRKLEAPKPDSLRILAIMKSTKV